MAIAAAAAAAAPAKADNLIFIRGGDVVVAAPDGAHPHRVTHGGGYTSVSQADDGTIFAHRQGELDRLSADGRGLVPPAGVGALLDLDVAPDGSKLAVSYAAPDGSRVTLLGADGKAGGWDDQSGGDPSWIGGDLVPYSNGAGSIHTLAPGIGNWSQWFGDPDGRKSAPAMTAARDRLAVVVTGYDAPGPYSIAWYANASSPPTDGGFGSARPPEQRPVLRCTVDAGGAEPAHLAFSSDGRAIAFEQSGAVRVQPPVDLGSCAQPAGGVTIAGASSLDWGPADVPAPGAARSAARPRPRTSGCGGRSRAVCGST